MAARKLEIRGNLENAYADVYSADSWATVPLLAKVFFQTVFAGTAATIVSGAVAERIKYSSFVVFSFVLVAVIYPITGHWIWGGGWLASMGFWDFAGSTAVHSVASRRDEPGGCGHRFSLHPRRQDSGLAISPTADELEAHSVLLGKLKNPMWLTGAS